jgi:hypothetical protein
MDLDFLEAMPSWKWPPNAGAILLKVLRDSTARTADRVRAAELSGEFVVANDGLMRSLARIAADESEPADLRGRAAIALGPVLEMAYIEGWQGDDTDPDPDVPINPATYFEIQDTLRRVCQDAGAPEEVRRRALEASVRAPEGWHKDAVRSALASTLAWQLTAVFCMRYLHGFDAEIMAALDSEHDAIRYEAVRAAGAHGVEAAWPDVVRIIERERSDKPLLLAAIEAVASIRPEEAEDVLCVLSDLEDEEIEEAVFEALGVAGADLDDEDEDDF